jgi:hypothetical protein
VSGPDPTPPGGERGVDGAAAAILVSSTLSGQAQTPTFRLLTFDASGDPRLGATLGHGEHDVLDVHNGVRHLLHSGAPEAQNLPYIPADMRTLAGAGPRATAAIRDVYRTLAAQKAKSALKDPGGAFRVFYPHSAVKFLARLHDLQRRVVTRPGTG